MKWRLNFVTKKDCAIIMCPPLCDYPEAPNDQPGCELFDCPKCNNKMWLSEKKRGLLLMSYLRDFIEDNAHRSCIDGPAQLLLEIEMQQSEKLKEFK
jgi:hypothetical protein